MLLIAQLPHMLIFNVFLKTFVSRLTVPADIFVANLLKKYNNLKKVDFISVCEIVLFIRNFDSLCVAMCCRLDDLVRFILLIFVSSLL